MKKINLFLLTIISSFIAAYAQIGYQVSIIDQSTGKPKANENVSVTVTITNNDGATICTETKNVTTNEVGVAALEIGNAKTFDNVDWNKLPLWVSATVGDITIAKSQILNVPVAECAKSVVPIDMEKIKGRWKVSKSSKSVTIGNSSIIINYSDGTPDTLKIIKITPDCIVATGSNEEYVFEGILYPSSDYSKIVMIYDDYSYTLVK